MKGIDFVFLNSQCLIAIVVSIHSLLASSYPLNEVKINSVFIKSKADLPLSTIDISGLACSTAFALSFD